MGETVYLALMIWADRLPGRIRARTGSPRKLRRRASATGRRSRAARLCLCGAMLTRYDGWFLAAVLWSRRTRSAARGTGRTSPKAATRALRARWRFNASCSRPSAALWLSYNYLLSRHPMDFANGPYSAKAIAERTTPKGAATVSGQRPSGDGRTLFPESGKARHGGRTLAIVLFGGCSAGQLRDVVSTVRAAWMWLLLWTPLAFYASLHRLRQRSDLHAGVVAVLLLQRALWIGTDSGLCGEPGGADAWKAALCRSRRRWKIAVPIAGAQRVIAGGYVWSWRATPMCLREARANGKARMSLDTTVARYIAAMPRERDHPDADRRRMSAHCNWQTGISTM